MGRFVESYHGVLQGEIGHDSLRSTEETRGGWTGI
jgi:hypothetical protein